MKLENAEAEQVREHNERFAKGEVSFPILPEWGTAAMLTLAVASADKTLAVMVSPDKHKWRAMALETGHFDTEQVLDDHAHKILGLFDKAGEAIEAAEKYATEWLKGRIVPEPKCGCEEIPPP